MNLGQLNVNSIRSKIKTILDDANTTTGSPIDLSANVSSRVKMVALTHPEKLLQQRSKSPLIAIYSERKLINSEGIAANMVNPKRRGELNLKIAGIILNQNTSSATEDPSDKDMEYLMENIEEVLRSFPNLDGETSVLWAMPTDISYFSAPGKSVYFRAAIMDLTVRTQY